MSTTENTKRQQQPDVKTAFLKVVGRGVGGAARNGDLLTLKRLLETAEGRVDQSDLERALFLAAEHCKAGALEILFIYGAHASSEEAENHLLAKALSGLVHPYYGTVDALHLLLERNIGTTEYLWSKLLPSASKMNRNARHSVAEPLVLAHLIKREATEGGARLLPAP